MSVVASRELRNHTADLLRRVSEGEDITITVHGQPVAQLVPIRPATRRPLARDELYEVLTTSQADAGLREDLARLAGETTDELGPIG